MDSETAGFMRILALFQSRLYSIVRPSIVLLLVEKNTLEYLSLHIELLIIHIAECDLDMKVYDSTFN